jgi:hypothetical protein
MQKEAQREINELKLKKESGEIKEKEFKEKEVLIFKQLDDFTEEYETLQNLLKSLKVGAVL